MLGHPNPSMQNQHSKDISISIMKNHVRMNQWPEHLAWCWYKIVTFCCWQGNVATHVQLLTRVQGQHLWSWHRMLQASNGLGRALRRFGGKFMLR
jgi:hypothetical protein